MQYLSDLLLFFGASGAGLYCYVLSRRLRRFTDLEKGVGGAVAVLSMQVDDLTTTLDAARKSARDSVHRLDDVSGRAESAARRLELLVASLHDLPEPMADTPDPIGAFFVRDTERVSA